MAASAVRRGDSQRLRPRLSGRQTDGSLEDGSTSHTHSREPLSVLLLKYFPSTFRTLFHCERRSCNARVCAPLPHLVPPRPEGGKQHIFVLALWRESQETQYASAVLISGV